MKNSCELIVAYDGDALKLHTMDVKDLAPALLSLGELLEDSNRIINGGKLGVKVKVKALSQGSFEIHLDLLTNTLTHLSSFLSGNEITSILNLKEILFTSESGIIGIIIWMRGRKPKIKDLKNGYHELNIEGNTIVVSSKALTLLKDIGIRQLLERIVEPLKKEGISEFFTIEKNKKQLSISKEDVKYFEAPTIEEEKIVEYEHEAAYSIISLAFKEDNKWRLHDGTSTISVSVKDKEFLNKVEKNHISFTKGDILICSVKTIQWRTATGLKIEYELLKVKDHQKASRQLDLFDNEPEKIT